ncbi:Acetylornithine/succinyldiaminopimelate aminotransferase [Streptomyces antimycoticus]
MSKAWPGSQGGTYGANAVACAAAAATLDVVREENLVANAEAMGARLRSGLEEVAAKTPAIGDVRGLGLMLASEFVTEDGEPDPATAARVQRRRRGRGTVAAPVRGLEPCGPDDPRPRHAVDEVCARRRRQHPARAAAGARAAASWTSARSAAGPIRPRRAPRPETVTGRDLPSRRPAGRCGRSARDTPTDWPVWRGTSAWMPPADGARPRRGADRLGPCPRRPTRAGTAPFAPAAPPPADGASRHALEVVNAGRARAGAAPVALDGRLTGRRRGARPGHGRPRRAPALETRTVHRSSTGSPRSGYTPLTIAEHIVSGRAPRGEFVDYCLEGDESRGPFHDRGRSSTWASKPGRRRPLSTGGRLLDGGMGPAVHPGRAAASGLRGHRPHQPRSAPLPGWHPLAPDPRLMAAAQAHSDDMVARDFYAPARKDISLWDRARAAVGHAPRHRREHRMRPALPGGGAARLDEQPGPSRQHPEARLHPYRSTGHATGSRAGTYWTRPGLRRRLTTSAGGPGRWSLGRRRKGQVRDSNCSRVADPYTPFGVAPDSVPDLEPGDGLGQGLVVLPVDRPVLIHVRNPQQPLLELGHLRAGVPEGQHIARVARAAVTRRPAAARRARSASRARRRSRAPSVWPTRRPRPHRTPSPGAPSPPARGRPPRRFRPIPSRAALGWRRPAGAGGSAGRRGSAGAP